MRRRDAHARSEDNQRVQDLVAKETLTESEMVELRRYTGWGGLSDLNAGQFFTPSVVGQFVHELLDPEPGSEVLDPQAGIGRLLEPWAGEHHISAVEVDPTAGRALRHLYPGANVAIGSCLEADLPDSGFDYVVANPPFGIRADVEVPWKAKNPVMETWTFDLVKRVLRPTGRAAIIVPDGILDTNRDKPFREWVLKHMYLRAVISLPSVTFQAAGTNCKTSIVVVEQPEIERELVRGEVDYQICMAIVEHVGFDSRGRETGKSDLRTILGEWRKFLVSGGWRVVPVVRATEPTEKPVMAVAGPAMPALSAVSERKRQQGRLF